MSNIRTISGYINQSGGNPDALRNAIVAGAPERARVTVYECPDQVVVDGDVRERETDGEAVSGS
jgi:hypothetical protein